MSRQDQEIERQKAIQNAVRISERKYWADRAAELRESERHNGGPPLADER